MSNAAEETEEYHFCCANCGIAGVDDVKLEECTACDLVKYCSNKKCREEHREQHEEECKKRQALLHDRKLFEQLDETHHGECPICFLPMPLDPTKYVFHPCCCNFICYGCVHANLMTNEGDRCPFCREPMSSSDEEAIKRIMKRIKANDPAALSQMGASRYHEGDYDGSLEYWMKAAELGDVDAHYRLGCMYGNGEGVEKDEEKAVYHSETAAIGGHPMARHNLAVNEEKKGNNERSVKHFIIAANLGYEKSMKALWRHYSLGYITKEDLDATLRTHHAAIDATKSKQRDRADLEADYLMGA